MIGNGSGEGSSMNVVGADGIGGMKKGPWTAAEDAILMDYVKRNGEGNWNAVQKNSGLSRCGKSCRLRWANHLRPNLKKGSFAPEEERIILELHSKIGNKWARMATQLPGRTDNEIKNYWNTRIKRRQRSGLPLYPPDIQHRQNGFQNQSRLSPITLANETKPHFGGGNPHPHPLSHQTPISLFNSFPMGFTNGPTMAVPIPPQAQPQPQPQPLVGHHHSVFPNPEAQTLFPRMQHLKRGREEGLDYSSMFGSNIVSTAVPMAVPMVRLGSRPNGPQLPQLQQQQQHQNLTALSMKMELPSSQYLPATASNHDSDPWVHQTNNNSGLLDALLEDTHGANRKITPESECIKRTDDNKTGDDAEFAKTKMEPLETGISETEDLSAFFELMTQTNIPIEEANALSSSPQAAASTWAKNESGETSNGQSSGVTEEDLVLDMQQLSSCIPLQENDHHHWNQWDNMSGIS